MRIDELKRRLSKNRPMRSVTLRMPEDVVEELKRVAAALEYSGYQPLMRAYIGRGLRRDLEKLEGNVDIVRFVNRLEHLGVAQEVIEKAMNDAKSA